jgi:ribosome assembly protein RRB1
MSKRAPERPEEDDAALKAGDRPMQDANGIEDLEFEDEYEDEYESEDEVFEAGVDGRPDAEREAEEQRGTYGD